MNNILDFNEFQKNLETTYDELNEKNAFRGLGNKLAQGRIRNELAEEIEISKSIMSGIQEGLDSLSDNFGEIKKSIDSTDDESVKGEKSKTLDSITKLIEQSRKTSWDLNDLIDEGEIDYAGFTANVGFSTLLYFGVLIFPIRTSIMVHKGYNYFFTLIRNTIRKALVMLQLNFDQFENLIITKSFQSSEYMNDRDRNADISEFYATLRSKLFDDKSGMLKGQKGYKNAEKMMTLAKQQIDLMYKNRKSESQSLSAYNCLDQYNNTYTKSLETLRNYSQEDVQKQLDAIKTTMTKLAADDKDYLAYSELIIAAAEEHAYKVSSSIYTRFAKMTEVFSLPNQKKMIDLIQEATKEKLDNANKMKEDALKSERLKIDEEMKEKLNKEGAKIFSSLSTATIGKLKNDKYQDIVGADTWNYDEYKKLDDEKQDTFVKWLSVHPEVCEKCHDTLQVLIPANNRSGYFEYVDSLIDYISPCIRESYVSESCIMSFDEYINESRSAKYFIDINKSKDQADEIRRLYRTNSDVAVAALETIGKLYSKNKFTDNAEVIVNKIKSAVGAKTPSKGTYKFVYISLATYNILRDSIDDLKKERDNGYINLLEKESERKNEESES